MSFLLGLLGLSGGVSGGSSQSTQNTNQTSTATGATSGTSTSAPTYSAPQTGLQGSLATALMNILQGNGSSPQVEALQTQAADQINQSYSTTADRMNRFLASRGFGRSGLTGGAQLQTELGRQGALANNNANFAGLALNQWNTGLADALNFAFANPGYSGATTGTTSDTSTSTGTQTNKSSGSGYSAGVGGYVGSPSLFKP
jgi:hypothetical protein